MVLRQSTSDAMAGVTPPITMFANDDEKGESLVRHETAA
jgi:hypothetical protein